MVEFAAKKVRKLCRPDSSEVDLDQSEACLVHSELLLRRDGTRGDKTGRDGTGQDRTGWEGGGNYSLSFCSFALLPFCPFALFPNNQIALSPFCPYFPKCFAL